MAVDRDPGPDAERGAVEWCGEAFSVREVSRLRRVLSPAQEGESSGAGRFCCGPRQGMPVRRLEDASLAAVN